MKLRFITTLQGVGGSLTSSVPSTIKNALKLKKGEQVEWNIDFGTNPPTVTFTRLEKE